MKRLDLIINGKGGVGKSFFAVNFTQFLKDKGIAHVAIDSDNENSTLKRFHPEAQFLDLSNRRELDGIFGALEKANLVLVDCLISSACSSPASNERCISPATSLSRYSANPAMMHRVPDQNREPPSLSPIPSATMFTPCANHKTAIASTALSLLNLQGAENHRQIPCLWLS